MFALLSKKENTNQHYKLPARMMQAGFTAFEGTN